MRNTYSEAQPRRWRRVRQQWRRLKNAWFVTATLGYSCGWFMRQLRFGVESLIYGIIGVGPISSLGKNQKNGLMNSTDMSIPSSLGLFRRSAYHLRGYLRCISTWSHATLHLPAPRRTYWAVDWLIPRSRHQYPTWKRQHLDRLYSA